MTTEANIQAILRCDAPNNGAALWRNNNGACMDARSNRMIRYGLGNDSKKLNEVWKSSDLIGITPILIQPQHVGLTFGVFTAVEVKAPGWKWSGTDREVAQAAFLKDVDRMGGIGLFEAHADRRTYLETIRNRRR